MKLKSIETELTVCRVTDYSQTDLSAEFCFTGRTDEEFSLVCPSDKVPGNCIEKDGGWRGFRIEGVLDFSLVGILAKLSKILADEEIGIFAISTYNTDYILVKKENMADAVRALTERGYDFD